MTTAFTPRGNAISFARKAEAIYGVAPSGNWTLANIYKHTIVETAPPPEDPLLGQARANNRDPLEPGAPLPVVGGDVDVPLDCAQFGYWLTDLFGAPTTSGASDPYTHTWVSGGEVLPSLAFETKLTASLFFRYLGLHATKMELNVGNAAGYDMATVTYFGRQEVKGSSSVAGTPSTIATRSPLAKAIGTVKINGTAAGSVMSLKATYDQGIKPSLFAGDPRPTGGDLDTTPHFNGSLQMRFRDATFYDLAKPSSPALVPAPVTLELLWQVSASRSLSILANAVRLEPSGVPINGPDGLEWTANFRAEQTASLAMLTVTLKSPTATF